MSQTLPVNDFEWVEKLSEFDEHFIKKYDEKVIKDIFKICRMSKKFIQSS